MTSTQELRNRPNDSHDGMATTIAQKLAAQTGEKPRQISVRMVATDDIDQFITEILSAEEKRKSVNHGAELAERSARKLMPTMPTSLTVSLAGINQSTKNDAS